MFWPIRNLSIFFWGLSTLTIPGAIAVIVDLYKEYCIGKDPQLTSFMFRMLLVMAIPTVCIALAVGFRKLYKCLCEESYSVFARTANK